MSKDKGYNGWRNFETWAVALWLDNERHSHDWALDTARECLASAQESGGKFAGVELGVERCAIGELARVLCDEINDNSPVWESNAIAGTMYSDLLGAALSEVDWHELAEHYLETLREQEDAS